MRLAGGDRTATAAALARFAVGDEPGYPAGLGFPRGAATLARGDAFADALAGASYAGRAAAPLLLTANPTVLGVATGEHLTALAGVTRTLTVFGGDTAVAPGTVDAAMGALGR